MAVPAKHGAGHTLAETSESSSEDEDDLARFKEAVYDTNFFKTEGNKVTTKTEENKQILPSKRQNKEATDTDDFGNSFQTTPGFRRHVSRKLSEALDSEIDSTDQCFKTGSAPADLDDGVKLFSSSTKLLTDETLKPQTSKPVRKRPQSPSSDSSSEDERLAEASVSHDFIMEQSNVPYMTNHKPADLIIKQPDLEQPVTKSKQVCSEGKQINSVVKNGQGEAETMMHNSINDTEKDDAVHIVETHTNSCKKKKKKHKKKRLETPD